MNAPLWMSTSSIKSLCDRKSLVRLLRLFVWGGVASISLATLLPVTPMAYGASASGYAATAEASWLSGAEMGAHPAAGALDSGPITPEEGL